VAQLGAGEGNVRCDLEVVQALGQTVSGQLAAPTSTPPVTFHGWLELLRALETALAQQAEQRSRTRLTSRQTELARRPRDGVRARAGPKTRGDARSTSILAKARPPRRGVTSRTRPAHHRQDATLVDGLPLL
jgi:hypothetical protein